MDDKKWNEEQIEKMLRGMPGAEDERSKEEVWQRLQQDPRLQTSSPAPKRKRKQWMPFAAAAAALLLLALFMPSFLQKNDVATEDAKSSDYSLETAEIEQSGDEAGPAAFSGRSAVKHYALYPSALLNETAFHIGLVSDQAAVVPVTLLLPNERVNKDLSGREMNSLALYETYAGAFDQTLLGFTSYHPYNAEFASENGRLLMKFPEDHAYDESSAALEMLTLSVQETFIDFDEIALLKEDGGPIEFDQVGEVEKPMKLAGLEKQQAYFVYDNNGGLFLSPNFGESFDTLAEALDAMKETPNDFYASAVPESVDFTADVQEETVQITFTQTLNLETLQQDEAMQLIEGLALTAASFGKQLQLDQIAPQQWNGFDFSNPLEKPAGANPLPFPFN